MLKLIPKRPNPISITNRLCSSLVCGKDRLVERLFWGAVPVDLVAEELDVLVLDNASAAKPDWSNAARSLGVVELIFATDLELVDALATDPDSDELLEETEFGSELDVELILELEFELGSELDSELTLELEVELGSELDDELTLELGSKLDDELILELDAELFEELLEVTAPLVTSVWPTVIGAVSFPVTVNETGSVLTAYPLGAVSSKNL